VTEDEEERAAILEYDAGFPRAEAERLATEKPWETEPHYWEMVAAAMDIFEVKEIK
jgi:hypothetical protein